MMLPDAVRHHPRQERFGRIDHELGQLEPATAFRRLLLTITGDDLQEPTRHRFAQNPMVAPNMNRLVPAGAVGHGHSPSWRWQISFHFPDLIQEGGPFFTVLLGWLG